MGHNQAVGSHVGHVVQWAGNHDRNRDASASDEGTPHGLGFFQVEEILADQGTCKRYPGYGRASFHSVRACATRQLSREKGPRARVGPHLF